VKRIRFRIDLTSGCSIGPGKIALLEQIRDTGSLSAAARRLGMSYRRAWLLLDNLNRSFRAPLTSSSVGGRGGGGVILTELGCEVLATYNALDRDIERLATRRCSHLVASARSEQRDGRRSLARSTRARGSTARRRAPKPP
jgi:molybdate transport system regulatory protein